MKIGDRRRKIHKRGKTGEQKVAKRAPIKAVWGQRSGVDQKKHKEAADGMSKSQNCRCGADS